MTKRRAAPRPAKAEPPAEGLAPRRLAIAVLERVLGGRVALDDALAAALRDSPLEGRDKALARSIAIATLRRLGTVRAALAERLAQGVPRHCGPLELVLATGAAQILELDIPDHAAVDCAVRLAREDRRSAGFAGLANAVLRRIARERDAILAASDPLDTDTPPWLAGRWRDAWGEDAARAIAAAHRAGAAIDVTVKDDPAGWAARLDGVVMPGGSVRVRSRVPVADLPGYAEGAWWVQDAAAAVPARLIDARPGERVIDLCAAPGGKTAQLLAAGAAVTAVDRSRTRLVRLRENLARLGLSAEVVESDALAYDGAPVGAILLDAPCSSTGTIRRNPDVPWVKTPADIAAFAGLQRRLLDKAASLLKPGGRLVYATCSLEPEEGEAQAAAFLAAHPEMQREPIRPDEVPGLANAIDTQGDLRILPSLWPAAEARIAGLDGFFAARFVKIAASAPT